MTAKRDLYIIGAGDFGRVMEYWLDLESESDPPRRLAGFLHSYEGKSPLEGFPTNLEIVGDWRDFQFKDTDLCLMGLSDPTWKREIHGHLRDKVEFMTYIHPTVALNRKFHDIGPGAVICPHCAFSTNIRLGACVTIVMGTQLGHDVIVGDYASLMAGVEIGGRVRIGDDSFIGSSATVIPGKELCAGAYIGAGSVVVRNVQDTGTQFGNPAHTLTFREKADMK
jgi:sugar O-acyltransferase (sialic acid O-acetyltransferase NeuD family)